MDFAWTEFHKGVQEDESQSQFLDEVYKAAVQQTIDDSPTLSLLSDVRSPRPSILPRHSSAASPFLEQIAHPGKAMARQNPDIAKYFEGVRYEGGLSKTDKHVSRKKKGWQVTAWCAAFVNWCLKQAERPVLARADAAAWIKYGVELPCPVYGCVTVLWPSDSQQTTGHVGFLTKVEAGKVILLGGNQSDEKKRSYRVSEQAFPAERVRGHRWPTEFSDILIDRKTKAV
jgi:uncharacterized protein (TIGR02594 family)